MGLTIHYTLKSKQEDAKQIVAQMRQLALDLPFEEVGEIVDLQGKECDYEARRDELQKGDNKNETLFWLLIQAGERVRCPWNKDMSRTVMPARIIAFDTWPGEGSEAANIGLCQYPAEIEWEYKPQDDQRFQEVTKDGGWERHRFSWDKWQRFRKRHGYDFHYPLAYAEPRQVPTKLAGWHWNSFCKTQYASNPECGGIPNFLRCHISVITLLDRIAAKVPGVRVRVSDEGHYGAHTRSDDWEEARAAGRRPTYRRHKGLYNPAALAQEVGDWNQFIAGFAGVLGDALAGSGLKMEAGIKDFPNFEQLEFKGRNRKHLTPFLKAMKSLAKAK